MDTGFANRRDSASMSRDYEYNRENRDSETIYRLRSEVRELEAKLKIFKEAFKTIKYEINLRPVYGERGHRTQMRNISNAIEEALATIRGEG